MTLMAGCTGMVSVCHSMYLWWYQ